MSVLEALALGTPVAFIASGIAEAVGVGAGLALDATADPANWARSLEGFVSNDDAGAAVSEAARRRFVEAFDVNRTAARTVEVYRDAISARR